MRVRSSLPLALAALVTLAACSRDDSPTGPAGNPTEARVFTDNFIAADFQAFGGSKLDAVQLDNAVRFRGSASLRVTVPAPTDPNGNYAGGAFVTPVGRDLTQYDALTFYARSEVPATLNVAGLGNDNTGNSQYTAERNAIALTTAWQKYTIPIPLAARLNAERGLFYFAEGAEGAAGYQFWLDDIQFETLGTITNPRPVLPPDTITGEIGSTSQLGSLPVTFAVDGSDVTVTAMPAYFTFTSSNTSVATVNASGLISVVAAGSANISAALGSANATGGVLLNAAAPPTTAAADPTRDAADVVSLFSGAYTNQTVDTWSATWDQADVSDVTIAGNAVKRYSNLVFAGIEFTSAPVNATAMTHLSMDIYINDATRFAIKLVDFGADGVFGGGNDTEHEVVLTPSTTPGLVAGQWNRLEIPFSAFTGLAARGHLAQLIIGGSSAVTYLDNVFFYRVAGPTAPTAAAPTPTAAAGNVISLFSNAYTNVPVNTWSTDWDQADVADAQVAGNDVKLYTNFTFAGIEFTGANSIDASAMTTFHFDIWTPDATDAPAEFRVKLVDFGPDNAFQGGDDTEHELIFTAASSPALASGQWVSFAIPLANFTGLTNRANLSQLIFVSGPNTVYLDNVYFSASTALTAPDVAAPTPTYAAGDVISLFSNPYTNVTVNTWSTDWDQTDVADVQVAGNDTKRYTNLVFAGIEFTGANVIDATLMTHFRMDIWTPDATAAPAVFRVKLVDFGADGAFQGGDDVEHELSFDATTTPALTTGNWITLDIPLAQFTGLTTRAHLAQLIIVGVDPVNTVFIDNVLLHR